jgi:hypothetical protein
MEPIEASPAFKTGMDRLVNERKRHWEERNNLVHGLRRLTFMREDLVLPGDHGDWVKQPPRIPIILRLNQTVAGAIAKGWPIFEVAMRDENEELAAKGATWAVMALQDACRKVNEPLLWKYIAALVGDGGAVWKVMRHKWVDMPLRNEGEEEEAWRKRMQEFVDKGPAFPLFTMLIDILTFLPSTARYAEEDVVVEDGMRGTFETLRTLRLLPKDTRLRDVAFIPEGKPYPIQELPSLPASVRVTEIWANDYVDFVVAHKHFVFKNPYGFKPYVHVKGMPSGLSDPALESLPIGFALQSIQPWLNILLALKMSWAARVGVSYGVSPALDPAASVSAGAQIAPETIESGRMYTFPPGSHVTRMETAFAGEELRDAIRLFMDLRQELTLPPVVSGFIGTRTPGLTQTAAVQQAVAMLQPLVDNAQFGLADLIKLYFRFIRDNIKARVTVSGFDMTIDEGGGKPKVGAISWGPEEVNKVNDVLVTLSMETLQDVVSKGQHAVFMVHNKLWSEDRGMRFGGVTDVKGERRKQEAERLREHPVIRAYVDQQLLSEEPALAAIAEQLYAPEEAGGMGGEVIPPEEGMGKRNIGGPAPRGGGRAASSPRQPGGAGHSQPKGRLT